MKLLNFIHQQEVRLGIRLEHGVIDVRDAANRMGLNVPHTVHQVIEGGQEAISALALLIERTPQQQLIPEERLTVAPCVTNPGKIICIGLNYRKHAEETNAAIPQYPILFNKFSNALCAHRAPIYLPRGSAKVDYEAELAIVVGKEAKYVTKEESLSYVFGYCNANDLSARDLQFRTNQWLLGKSCDGFCPIGPYLVTRDEIADPNQLDIRTYVNGELRQHSNTADMIFYCDEIVSYVSQYMTLMPGDIILTGTPEGVVLGYPEERQVYLQDGDVVTIEIEKLGTLTNRMVAEAP